MGGDAAAMATALEATRVPGRETNARRAVRPRAPRRRGGGNAGGRGASGGGGHSRSDENRLQCRAFFNFFRSLRKFWLLFAVWQQSVSLL